MSMHPPGTRPRESAPMVLPFPWPGRLIQDAYQDLEVAANSSLQRLPTFSGLDDLFARAHGPRRGEEPAERRLRPQGRTGVRRSGGVGLVRFRRPSGSAAGRVGLPVSHGAPPVGFCNRSPLR